tara:strand:- start:50755 stop:52071 length:1317 start_codon:yes stop_codon:yes gene_type:complete
MAYFNHAFKKCFGPAKVLKNAAGAKPWTYATGGDFGACLASDWSGVTYATGATDMDLLKPNQGFYLVGKGYRTSDTIGSNPGHGGYTETWKSKMILPKYINKIWKTNATEAQANKITISTSAGTASQSCFTCASVGANNFLRLDVKGAAALRFLNHNAYMIFDTGTSCTACNGGYMNNIYAVREWAIGICDDPIINKFVKVNKMVYNLAGGAGDVTVNTCATIKTDAALNTAATAGTWLVNQTGEIEIEAAYVDTEWGSCSFETTDFSPSAEDDGNGVGTTVAKGEPLQMQVSFLDESGTANSCDCAAAQGTKAITVNTTAKQANISAYTVMKDLLLDENYAQMPYNQGNRDSARFRKAEGSDLLYAEVHAGGLYESYDVLHSVPRRNNPSGVMDNDQYHYSVYVRAGASTTLLDTMWDEMAVAAFGSGSTAETIDIP